MNQWMISYHNPFLHFMKRMYHPLLLLQVTEIRFLFINFTVTNFGFKSTTEQSTGEIDSYFSALLQYDTEAILENLRVIEEQQKELEEREKREREERKRREKGRRERKEKEKRGRIRKEKRERREKERRERWR